MKHILFLVMMTAGIVQAQQLTPSVVASSGGFYNTSTGMLSFTTGELVAVETYSSSEFIVTQGFQQPWDFGTYVIDDYGTGFAFNVFPNPSDGVFSILTESEQVADLEMRITDYLGRIVHQMEFAHQGRQQVRTCDLPQLSSGLYFLSLTVGSNGTSGTGTKTVFIEIVK